MVGSMFSAVAGLKAHQTRLDVLGNNIANVNTWGYKAQTAHLEDSAYRNYTVGNGNLGVRGGGVNTSQIGYGSRVGYVSVNYTTGNWNPTGYGSDCMINGAGFFIVTKNLDAAKGTTTANADPEQQDAVAEGTCVDATYDGAKDFAVTSATGMQLSRVGILGIDNEGYIVDSNGYYVLDYQGNAIQVPKKTGNDVIAGGAANQYYSFAALTIQKDGTITGVIESPIQHANKELILGQLGIASVQNVNGLQHNEGYYYDIGPNAGTVTGSVTNAATGDILGGYLEMSNTDLASEITTMITTQRGYQANTRIVTVTDEMLQELINMKR